MSVDIASLAVIVYKVLGAAPIQLLDEETQSVYATESWELVSARSAGAYTGSREIGSANMLTAYNLVHSKTIATGTSLETFYTVIDHLVQQRLIRKHPKKMRESFTVV